MERVIKVIKTAGRWTKAILAIGVATALLTAAWLVWTTRIYLFPVGHPLYGYETEVQLAMAALLAILPAGLAYFVLRKFFATLVLALIAAGILLVTGLLAGAAVEKLGGPITLALMAFPALAAVATKAANIASGKECDASVYRKFKESFDEALDQKMSRNCCCGPSRGRREGSGCSS